MLGAVASPRRSGRALEIPVLQEEHVHGLTLKSCVALEKDRREGLVAMIVAEERITSEGVACYSASPVVQALSRSAIFFSLSTSNGFLSFLPIFAKATIYLSVLSLPSHLELH